MLSANARANDSALLKTSSFGRSISCSYTWPRCLAYMYASRRRGRHIDSTDACGGSTYDPSRCCTVSDILLINHFSQHSARRVLPTHTKRLALAGLQPLCPTGQHGKIGKTEDIRKTLSISAGILAARSALLALHRDVSDSRTRKLHQGLAGLPLPSSPQ